MRVLKRDLVAKEDDESTTTEDAELHYTRWRYDKSDITLGPLTGPMQISLTLLIENWSFYPFRAIFDRRLGCTGEWVAGTNNTTPHYLHPSNPFYLLVPFIYDKLCRGAWTRLITAGIVNS
jgi:hypothetical protein